MALSEANQELLDLDTAREAARRTAAEPMESKLRKQEMVRIATDTLTFNKGSLAVSERSISSDEIIAFATALVTYIES